MTSVGREHRRSRAGVESEVFGSAFLLRRVPSALGLLLALGLLVSAAAGQSNVGGGGGGSEAALSPPGGEGPLVVTIRMDVNDLNEIDDQTETFEFSGIMTSRWRDARQAFDPEAVGVSEKVFQGGFQFDEISPGWYPQIVLLNPSGLFEKSGVTLRVLPDGSCTLIETVNAVVETDIDMRRYPFDRHKLEARFACLGARAEDVVFEVETVGRARRSEPLRVPQWRVTAIQERVSTHTTGSGEAWSAFVLCVDVERGSFFVVRLVVLPLMIIVFLSFSVFWMDRSSLGDRISVSFIGILTGVAYQIVMADTLPDIDYFTLIHGFLNLSFLTMCATVLINLRVGSLDKRGLREAGDRLDRRCRWAFPLGYTGLALLMLAIALFGFS